MASIFHSFPAPAGPGFVTVGEQNGELNFVMSGQAKTKFPGYPEVTISKESTRSLTQRENAKSAFLPHDETVSKRAYHAWYEMGLSGALEEIVNSSEEVPPWIASTSKRLLFLTRWFNSLHGSFFPHLVLSNEDIVSKFSPIPEWSHSPVKAFAWHPHTVKFAYAIQDDSVRIHSHNSELVPILKHKLQKNVATLAWQPHSSSVLAVGCQSCILIWHIEPSSLASRPSSSSVQILQQSSHSPVTSLCWNPAGTILLSASPVDSAMMAWTVPMESCVQLRRFGGGGVSMTAWSPDGSKVFAATPSNLFRVWETSTWSCEKWSTSTGRCKSACWSPRGDILLFTTENQPVIFSLTFSDIMDESAPVIGGSQTAVACVDLTEVALETEDDSVKVGGLIQHMVWDSSGERLAVMFKDNRNYIALFRTQLYPVLEITGCGFIKGEDGEVPQHIEFQPKFEHGALLTVIWSSGRVGYIPLYFIPAGTVEYHHFQHQRHNILQQGNMNGLYSQ